MKLEDSRFLKLIFLVVLMTIIIWQLIIIPLEYFTTEYNLIYPKISAFTKTAFLFGLVFFFSFLLPKLSSFLQKKLPTFIVGFLFFIMLIIGNRYQSFYDQLQQFPKIYAKTPDWTIQGGQIKITGKNFGPAQVPGQVLLNDQLLTIKRWDNNQVVVQQPVLGEFGQVDLVLINYLNNQSNSVPHFIKDPAEL